MPYGKIFHQEGSEKYKFSNKELDSSNLYYFGARYYDSNTGRFTQIDPIFKSSESPYMYANNNPIKYVDSSGMDDNRAAVYDATSVNPSTPRIDTFQPAFNTLVLNSISFYGFLNNPNYLSTHEYFSRLNYYEQGLIRNDGLNPPIGFYARGFYGYNVFGKESAKEIVNSLKSQGITIDLLIIAGHGSSETIEMNVDCSFGCKGSENVMTRSDVEAGEWNFLNEILSPNAMVILQSCQTASGFHDKNIASSIFRQFSNVGILEGKKTSSMTSPTIATAANLNSAIFSGNLAPEQALFKWHYSDWYGEELSSLFSTDIVMTKTFTRYSYQPGIDLGKGNFGGLAARGYIRGNN